MTATDRLYRRVQMATASVTISATNDEGPVHLAQGKVRGTPETIDNLQTLNLYGFASHAPVGSDALVIFGNGDRSNGAIVATANQKARPRKQKAGEVTIFTDEGDAIALRRDHNIVVSTTDGTVTVEGAKLVIIKSSEKVRIETPRLEVTGDIIDHCDDQSHTAQNMREIYNTHTHGAVQTGGAHTAIPDQPQRGKT
jgi:phage baseplate assembly protein V